MNLFKKTKLYIFVGINQKGFTMRLSSRLLFILILSTIFSVCNAQNIIQLEQEGGVFKVPCTVNGLRLKLIFDTGASNVCISETIAKMMLENDYLSKNDIKGTSQSQVADGRIVDHTKIVLKSIKIGDKELKNVDAIVIYGQDAPLLLGQSALSKLGNYTISGDQLIFRSSSSQSKNDKLLSDEEIDVLFKEAYESYDENAFFVASEKFRILYDNNLLSATGKYDFANSLFFTERKEAALEIYYEILDEIESNHPDYKLLLYYQLGRSLFAIENYNEALSFFEKVNYYEEKFSERQESSVEYISWIYQEINNPVKARSVLEDYIKKYLEFKQYKPTDCWDKKKRDMFLGDMYYNLFLAVSSSFDDIEYKYLIISAAWGSEDGIDLCTNHGIEYSSKPGNYRY